MFTAIITAILSFISTNLDDIFIPTLLFAARDSRAGRIRIVCGQYLGIAVLVFLSLLGAAALQLIPSRLPALLGLFPIWMGIREWCRCDASDTPDTAPQLSAASARNPLKRLLHPELFGVAALTIANGADNLGVYVPLFAALTLPTLSATLIVYALMTGLWCFLALRLASLPCLKAFLHRYRRFLIPPLFILLGFIILISGLRG